MTQEKTPPNGSTKLARRILMFGAVALILFWIGAWIVGFSDREPPLLILVFLATLALTATSEGDKMLRNILDNLTNGRSRDDDYE